MTKKKKKILLTKISIKEEEEVTRVGMAILHRPDPTRPEPPRPARILPAP
jgi:hypothetical protein